MYHYNSPIRGTFSSCSPCCECATVDLGLGLKSQAFPEEYCKLLAFFTWVFRFKIAVHFTKRGFFSLKKRLDNQWTASEIFACCCCEWKLVVGGAGGAPEYLATFHLLFMRGDASVTWPRVVLARENKMAETPCGKTCFSIFQRKCRSCRSVSAPFTNYINAVSKCPVQKGL